MINIQPETTFQLQNPREFIRCWTFFYRLYHHLESCLDEDREYFKKNKSFNSFKNHFWHSTNREASGNGGTPAAPQPRGSSAAVENPDEVGTTVEDTATEEEEVERLIVEQNDEVEYIQNHN